MPELAEVEFYRRSWNCGLGQIITGIRLHARTRIFRGVPLRQLQQNLPGSRLVHSEANGKQMLFRFRKDLWIGLHLGMSGELQAAPPDFEPGRHDHLVLYQSKQALVFTDPRQFGRVRFSQSGTVPEWWSKLPIPVNSRRFARQHMDQFLQRHPKLPIKATLLLQAGFPGIGNWMADEILWRAKVDPRKLSQQMGPAQRQALWESLRLVCRGALRHISRDFADPPRGWLFHERWTRHGRCPIHGTPLRRYEIGGRSTAWCPVCQP
jgi:formamidopyrimidine-DNA glycosylase